MTPTTLAPEQDSGLAIVEPRESMPSGGSTFRLLVRTDVVPPTGYLEGVAGLLHSGFLCLGFTYLLNKEEGETYVPGPGILAFRPRAFLQFFTCRVSSAAFIVTSAHVLDTGNRTSALGHVGQLPGVDAPPAKDAESADSEPTTAEGLLDALQASLSLNISEIADVIGVARGTVYGWLKGDVVVPRDAHDAERLRDLYQISHSWSLLSTAPLGRLAKVPLGEGQPSLIDLLTQRSWDRQRIQGALELLAKYLLRRRTVQRSRRRRSASESFTSDSETGEEEQARVRGTLERDRLLDP